MHIPENTRAEVHPDDEKTEKTANCMEYFWMMYGRQANSRRDGFYVCDTPQSDSSRGDLQTSQAA